MSNSSYYNSHKSTLNLYHNNSAKCILLHQAENYINIPKKLIHLLLPKLRSYKHNLIGREVKVKDLFRGEGLRELRLRERLEEEVKDLERERERERERELERESEPENERDRDDEAEPEGDRTRPTFAIQIGPIPF